MSSDAREPLSRRWTTVDVDTAAADALAERLGIARPLARLLVGRGISEPAAAEPFLSPRLGQMQDPFRLPGMQEGVARIWQAIDAGERIAVFGDYDADGVTSTALLTQVLSALGGNVAPFIPLRENEGYGLTIKALTRCLEENKPSLVVTVDCGTCSGESVKMAADRGVDVVISDHHGISAEVAPAHAVINPALGGDVACELAGVGVAFKLCHAMVKAGLDGGRDAVEGIDLRPFLDLVALGTVADVVPLLGENRILVKHGLTRIGKGTRPGVNALKEVARVSGPVDASSVAFVLGPRLNAAGRLGNAAAALRLLLTDDAEEARCLAAELNAANSERKRIEAAILAEATAELDRIFDVGSCFGLVTAREGWHVGMIGIVASRLCNRYGRPSIVIGIDPDGRGRGSCRSIPALDLVDALRACEEDLETFGGHSMAAGLVVKPGRVDSFRERFDSECAARLAGADLRPEERVDVWLDSLGEADAELMRGLESLRPFGSGNPMPVWGVRDVRVVGKPRVVGNGHLKMTVAGGASQFDSIAFGMGDRTVPDGNIDLLFELQTNTFRGFTSLQLRVRDFRSSQAR